MWSDPKKYGGNIIVDFTGNSFLDGRHHGMVRYDEDHNTNYQNQAEGNVFEVMGTVGTHIGTLNVRPFKLKCHKMFENWKEYPKLGMQIEIEDADGKVKKSIITKAIWKFRGGWELGCTGSDNRVLSQAAKKSLASHESGNVKMYANYVASKLNGNIKEAQATAEAADSNATSAHESINTTDGNLRNTNGIARRNMEAISDAFLSLGVSLSYEYAPEE